jgi:Flp pilus assembly protein TadG
MKDHDLGSLAAALSAAIDAALSAATPFCGATAPNPPVGASAIDQYGNEQAKLTLRQRFSTDSLARDGLAKCTRWWSP